MSSTNELEGPRNENLDFFYEDLNKVTIVPGTAAVGKRGKGVGFYCEACNLTFKDSIQYLDHINSKQHLYNTTGSTDIDAGNSKITVENVRSRLKYLKEKKEKELKEAGMEFDLRKRIEQRKIFEEEQKQKKREKLKEKRVRKKESKKRKWNEVHEDSNTDNKSLQNMQEMMGFSGFGSTKN